MNRSSILRIAAAAWVVILLIAVEARPASSGVNEAQSQCYAIGIYRTCAGGSCYDERAAAWAGPSDALLTARTPSAIQQCNAHMVQMVVIGNSVPGSVASIMSPCAVYCTLTALTGPPSSPQPDQLQQRLDMLRDYDRHKTDRMRRQFDIK